MLCKLSLQSLLDQFLDGSGLFNEWVDSMLISCNIEFRRLPVHCTPLKSLFDGQRSRMDWRHESCLYSFSFTRQTTSQSFWVCPNEGKRASRSLLDSCTGEAKKKRTTKKKKNFAICFVVRESRAFSQERNNFVHSDLVLSWNICCRKNNTEAIRPFDFRRLAIVWDCLFWNTCSCEHQACIFK